MLDLNTLMTENERVEMGVAQMSEPQQRRLAAWGWRLYQVGKSSSTVSGWISEIKYGGHLIILNDDSRWEVDESDTDTAELWSMLDDVVVVDGAMYRLADLEKISVTQE